MAGTRTSLRLIADRYVSALFDYAQGDEKKLAGFGEFFNALEKVLAEYASLMEAFSDPTASRKDKVALAEDLAALLKAQSGEKNFLMLLAKNNRLELLPEIIATYRERYSSYKGEVVLEVITAHPATTSTLNALKTAVEKETGRATLLKTREDASLLGGVVIKLGSTMLDCSLAGRLARLEQSLKHRIANA